MALIDSRNNIRDLCPELVGMAQILRRTLKLPVVLWRIEVEDDYYRPHEIKKDFLPTQAHKISLALMI